MWRQAWRLAGLVGCLALAAAQEGHPLTGTWTGDWGPSVSERRHLTLVMYWDGENVTGVINPGPNSIPIDGVFLDVTDWTVRLQASAPDGGAGGRLTAEGRLETSAPTTARLRGDGARGTSRATSG